VRAAEPVRAEALRSVREDITKPSDRQERRPSFTILAGGYALLGERDTALVMLERAVAGHEERLMVALKAWPALASLRDEPRYRAVVRRVGLPE
jgi:hypothetical protein